jgi:hypothetical protein
VPAPTHHLITHQRKKNMNKRNFFIRALVSPGVLLLLAISYTYAFVKHFIAYMRWGGEFITLKKDDRKKIDDIFQLLKDELLKK